MDFHPGNMDTIHIYVYLVEKEKSRSIYIYTVLYVGKGIAVTFTVYG